MSPRGYFSCADCGRVYKMNKVELVEYREHDCTLLDGGRFQAGNPTLFTRLLDLVWKHK